MITFQRITNYNCTLIEYFEYYKNKKSIINHLDTIFNLMQSERYLKKCTPKRSDWVIPYETILADFYFGKKAMKLFTLLLSLHYCFRYVQMISKLLNLKKNGKRSIFLNEAKIQ